MSSGLAPIQENPYGQPFDRAPEMVDTIGVAPDLNSATLGHVRNSNVRSVFTAPWRRGPGLPLKSIGEAPTLISATFKVDRSASPMMILRAPRTMGMGTTRTPWTSASFTTR
jgi:hypothetical protein